MSRKQRRPGHRNPRKEPRRGGFRKSHAYEEHEYSKRAKNEYLHIRRLQDLDEEDRLGLFTEPGDEEPSFG